MKWGFLNERPILLGMGHFNAQRGGLNRYFLDEVTALRQRGAEPAALVSGLGGEHVRGTREGGLLAQRVLAYFQAVPRPVAGRVVDSHFALFTALPLALGRLRRAYLVSHFQGPWAEEARAEGDDNELHYKFRRGLERFVYLRARELVVLSSAFRDILIYDYRVLPSRISVVAPGVDLEHFAVLSSSSARDITALPHGRAVGLAVRRLAHRMGLDVLLRAWAALPGDPLLLLAGDGEARVPLEALRDELGLQERVRFLGRVSDEELPQLYAAADFTVVPSVALEGFGLIVLESLACGTPVIASDTGGMAEVLPDLDHSLLVPPGDIDALVARLRQAIQEPNSLPSAERCREFAERFAWPEVVDRLLDVFARARAQPPDRPFRVVYLLHSAALSGGELALVRLLQAMPDVQGHVILGERGPLERVLAAAGIDFEVMAMRGADARRDELGGRGAARSAVQSARYVARLTRRLRQLKPDLVHTNTLKAALYGGVAARAARIPVIVHVRDRLTSDYLPTNLVTVARGAVRVLPDAVIANSRATAAALRLPDGVDLTVVASPGPAVVGERPARAGRPLTVAAVGRLASWKGQDVAIRAFASAFAGGPELLHVAGAALFGEQAYAEGLRTLVDELGVVGQVVFEGHVEDVQALLVRCDVLVHTSVLPEPFGNVVVEGMAAGCAVVASDGGGPAEIISHDVDGLLTPMGDVSTLADTLRRLRDDASLVARLAQSGTGKSREYRPERAAEAVREVYLRVLRRHQKATVQGA